MASVRRIETPRMAGSAFGGDVRPRAARVVTPCPDDLFRAARVPQMMIWLPRNGTHTMFFTLYGAPPRMLPSVVPHTMFPSPFGTPKRYSLWPSSVPRRCSQASSVPKTSVLLAHRQLPQTISPWLIVGCSPQPRRLFAFPSSKPQTLVLQSRAKVVPQTMFSSPPEPQTIFQCEPLPQDDCSSTAAVPKRYVLCRRRCPSRWFVPGPRSPRRVLVTTEPDECFAALRAPRTMCPDDVLVGAAVVAARRIRVPRRWKGV